MERIITHYHICRKHSGDSLRNYHALGVSKSASNRERLVAYPGRFKYCEPKSQSASRACMRRDDYPFLSGGQAK